MSWRPLASSGSKRRSHMSPADATPTPSRSLIPGLEEKTYSA